MLLLLRWVLSDPLLLLLRWVLSDPLLLLLRSDLSDPSGRLPLWLRSVLWVLLRPLRRSVL